MSDEQQDIKEYYNHMVYLYSIISGFRAILGSTAIQLSMAMAVLLLVRVPTDIYTDDAN